MECFESSCHLYEYPPYVILLKVGLSLLQVNDLLVDVPVICVLHNDAEALLRILDERLFITDDIRMLDRSQDSDLVEGIFSLFLTQGVHAHLEMMKLKTLYLFECVYLFVTVSFDFEYLGVGALTCDC